MPEQKRTWDPMEMYDISEKEMRAVRERAKYREAMKKEYQMKATNPFRARVGDHIFDPALHRFTAMRSTSLEHFKPNPRSAKFAFWGFVFPFAAMYYGCDYYKKKYEQKIRNGEIAYKDRRDRFH